MKIKNIALLLLVVMSGAMLCGCGNDKKIVGAWSAEKKVDGVKARLIFEFDSDGSFERYMIPLKDNYVGFKAEGEWKVNLLGGLELIYDVSSVEPVFNGYFGGTDKDVKDFIGAVHSELRNVNDEGGSLGLKFESNDRIMELTTSDMGTIRFTRLDDDDYDEDLTSEPRRRPTLRPSRGGSSDGVNIPSRGSIEQFSYLAERELTHADLLGLSSAELRLLRNAIFARHGYRFNSADLQEYFGNFSDYYPVTSNVTDFNRIEKANIDFIKSYE